MRVPGPKPTVSLRSIPSLPKHIRLQFDPVRQAVAVLAPEQVLWPNEAGLDILRRCDGRFTVDHIIADLVTEYDAEQEEVAADVIAFLQDWSDKLLVKL
ncbi:pyrroloquinoline quinone biosynthesis peptide chaperone PqqD [Mesorhizobium sp. ES1-4]|uniref:pyrroloquinoline quinone biosynthesis peptide chaperone PqqD n=1 Tax=Mesorhizobium sp. ES1-4 TaxID=2876627 RepID=UPI001CCA3A07|nr:pyrroloquinoline quinone biosynthesis peptide chaperone PqqD [Mesorhizobium sp. ES1-4]MBZ9799447.1 pyrroloquinoline quinone biosynthesis peptide chaperone PqqD [Mesorhizobium sp. ES1-4]